MLLLYPRLTNDSIAANEDWERYEKQQERFIFKTTVLSSAKWIWGRRYERRGKNNKEVPAVQLNEIPDYQGVRIYYTAYDIKCVNIKKNIQGGRMAFHCL